MKIKLNGCKVTPIGSLLKGLGVFKLISDQLDPDATAWWENDTLSIDTSVDKNGIISFFTSEYQPSPILSPWNSGSGFYNQKKNILKQIQKTNSLRFSLYRDVIDSIQSFPELKDVKKTPGLTADSLGMNKERFKFAIMKRCENLDPIYLQWLHSVLYLDDDAPHFNKLLESGGNDGQLDYSGTFLRYVVMMMVDKKTSKTSPSLLANALFGEPTDDMVQDIVGKWYPAVAGGYNMGAGVKREHFLINPWDFIFTIEGVLMWSFGVWKDDRDTSPIFPFVTAVSPFGYPSASLFDADSSCEIWFPLWNDPMKLDKLKEMFGEKRLLRERPARNGMQFAALVFADPHEMEFLRYISSMRRGQAYSTFLAGRYHPYTTGNMDVLADIPPIDRLLKKMSQKEGDETHSKYYALRVALGNSFFTAIEQPQRFHDVLRILGRIEMYFASLPLVSRPHPLTDISPDWIALADDGSLEYRIAASIASIDAGESIPSIRPYVEPVNDSSTGWSEGAGRCVWSGHSLPKKMLSVLVRRSRDALSTGISNPFWSSVELPAGDIAAFIASGIDDAKIEELLFGMMLVENESRQEKLSELNFFFDRPLSHIPLPPSFSYLKTLFLPRPVYIGQRSSTVSPGSSLLSSLEAGKFEDALRDARQRLVNFGFTLNPVFPSSGDPARVAGALLLPVRFQGRMVERALMLKVWK